MYSEKGYPRIHVFITRGYKFRANIQESADSAPYEVTVGGSNWYFGRGKKHTVEIQEKIDHIIIDLIERGSRFYVLYGGRIIVEPAQVGPITSEEATKLLDEFNVNYPKIVDILTKIKTNVK